MQKLYVFHEEYILKNQVLQWWNGVREPNTWAIKRSSGATWNKEHTEIAIESYRISTGWWLSKPLWKMMEFVSWDYDIPNWMESHSKFHGSSHHQPVTINH
jgi:hypothetical protein